MIALVGHGFLDFHIDARLRQMHPRIDHTIHHRVHVGVVGGVDRRRQHHLGVEVDHVLGLVRQMGLPVFHLRNAAVGIGRRDPFLVRYPLVFPRAIEAAQLVVGRVFHTLLLLEQTPQIVVPVLTRVASDDRLHGGVGLQEGRVNGRRLAWQQPLFRHQSQCPLEHCGVNFQRQAVAHARQARMVRRVLRQRHAKEFPQRKAVGTPPGYAPLRADALEVTHQQHAEVHAGRNRRSADAAVIVRPAQLLGHAVEARLGKHLVELPIEHVSLGLWQAGGRHPHLLLLVLPFSQRHRRCPPAILDGDTIFLRKHFCNSSSPTFSTGC